MTANAAGRRRVEALIEGPSAVAERDWAVFRSLPCGSETSRTLCDPVAQRSYSAPTAWKLPVPKVVTARPTITVCAIDPICPRGQSPGCRSTLDKRSRLRCEQKGFLLAGGGCASARVRQVAVSGGHATRRRSACREMPTVEPQRR